MAEKVKRIEYVKLVEDKMVKKAKLPPFRPGDSIRVNVRIQEGDKERIQAFEGVCIRRKNNGANSSFTVRKISYGVGVERIFPNDSPMIEKVELLQHGDVRRAKLYYLRDLRGKAARVKTRRRANLAAAIAPDEPVVPVPETEAAPAPVEGTPKE